MAYISLQTSTHVAPVSWANRVCQIVRRWNHGGCIEQDSLGQDPVSRGTS